MAWSSGLPGGAWNMTATFTDATGTQGTAVLVYTLLVTNPNVRMALGGGNASSPFTDHFSPGQPLLSGFTLLDMMTGLPVDPALVLSGSNKVAVARLNLALGRIETLDASNAWVALGSTGLVYHTCTVSAGDTHVFTKTFSTAAGFDTSGWGYYDLVLLGKTTLLSNAGDTSGTSYSAVVQVENIGLSNRHSTQDFDPTGLFK